MNRILVVLLTLTSCVGRAQTDFNSDIEFTADLENFGNLSGWKESVEGVDIIALGENTHGLGEVFAAKAELVSFLHQELGFDLLLFESGYGDAALAWERLDLLSPREFTRVFSSNFYYHSEEIEELVSYVKAQNGGLKIQGFDCQPQQNYLVKRMTEIAQAIDSAWARSVVGEMNSFNKLYQLENDRDTLGFNQQRDRFVGFLNNYNAFLNENTDRLLASGATENEIKALKRSNEILLNTYAKITIGEMMGWPASANLRDESLFEIVQWFKKENPRARIMIWAQNSHIENKTRPNDNVSWMGHRLKSTYGDRYYSIGSVVYSGINLNYSGTFDFEHADKAYLAYHLNQFQRERLVLDLREYEQDDFTRQLLLGMESNGNTAEFIARDRFDGLLFIKHSDIPRLITKE